MKHTNFSLSETEIPEYYLNISYYLKQYLGKLPDPPLNPIRKFPLRKKFRFQRRSGIYIDYIDLLPLSARTAWKNFLILQPIFITNMRVFPPPEPIS